MRNQPRMYKGFLLEKSGGDWRISKPYKYIGLTYICSGWTLQDAKDLINTNGQSCPNPDYFLQPLKEFDEFEERVRQAKESV